MKKDITLSLKHANQISPKIVAMKKVLVWLRRDLRLYDNTALHHALQQNNQVWLAFIFDIGILKPLIHCLLYTSPSPRD